MQIRRVARPGKVEKKMIMPIMKARSWGGTLARMRFQIFFISCSEKPRHSWRGGMERRREAAFPL